MILQRHREKSVVLVKIVFDDAGYGRALLLQRALLPQ